MINHHCDILVTGAGPAGSSAAQKAAEKGLDVLLIDRKTVIGEPVRCAEFIPKQLLGELNCKKEFIVQPVKTMKTILPDRTITETPSPGCIINRNEFDQALAEKAQNAGAKIWTDTKAVGLNGNSVTLVKNSGQINVTAKIIIGADGPHTRIGKWIGSPNRNLLPAVQVKAALTEPIDYTEVYFDKRFYGGYAWLFPKGNTANIGLGIKQAEGVNELKNHLEYFLNMLKEEGRITGKFSGYTAGWIPADKPRKLTKGNVMLTGDAGGQTHPITGAGASQAVMCGRMAGKWAAEAVLRDNINLLSEYDDEWMDLYGGSQERAFKRRQLMENSWNDLDNIIKKCWVAFREYYKG